MPAAPFVDHYEVLTCSPDTSAAELKRAYHEKLREYHPDKRPESRGGTGAKVTQALLEAWEVLQDTEKRAAYDILWRKAREPVSAAEKAEVLRREGNEMYKEAQAVSKTAGPESLSAAASALHKYQAAIEKYSEGILLVPQDHRMRSNRALCYSALKDWARCKEEASAVISLKSDFMKGWFLLAKALWREGDALAAQRQLEAGLEVIPGSPELLALQEEMTPDVEAAKAGGERLPPVYSGRSRNVSPSCTPVTGHSRNNSRVATPPPVRGASNSPAPGARGRETSRPRAPSGARVASGPDFGEETAKFGAPPDYDRTANFGHSGVHARTGRSTSPAPAADHGMPNYAEGTFGPSGPRPPGAPPGMHTSAPPPPGPGPGPGPRQRVSTLAGMAASSRLGVHGA